MLRGMFMRQGCKPTRRARVSQCAHPVNAYTCNDLSRILVSPSSNDHVPQNVSAVSSHVKFLESD
jgi:hypothetical protein